MLEAGRVGHIAHNVIGQQLEGVRSAVRELPLKAFKQVVQFVLSNGAAPRPKDAHRLVPGPERPARGGVTIVKGQFRLIEVTL